MAQRRLLVVVCHPSPRSFTHSIAQQAMDAGAALEISSTLTDLYEDGFDPVLGRDEFRRRFSFDPLVQRYAEEIEGASRIVIAHPEWWGQPPAMLKGWVDRVFRPGIAYDYDGEEFLRKTRVPLFEGKHVLVFSGTDTSESEESGLLASFWRDVFEFCGVDDVTVHRFYDFHSATGSIRHDWLTEVGQVTANWLDANSNRAEDEPTAPR